MSSVGPQQSIVLRPSRISMTARQAGVDKETARDALKHQKGDVVGAIIELTAADLDLHLDEEEELEVFPEDSVSNISGPTSDHIEQSPTLPAIPEENSDERTVVSPRFTASYRMMCPEIVAPSRSHNETRPEFIREQFEAMTDRFMVGTSAIETELMNNRLERDHLFMAMIGKLKSSIEHSQDLQKNVDQMNEKMHRAHKQTLFMLLFAIVCMIIAIAVIFLRPQAVGVVEPLSELDVIEPVEEIAVSNLETYVLGLMGSFLAMFDGLRGV